MEGLAGRHPVEDLDTADLDEPIAAKRIESGRFRIENYFAHGPRFKRLLRQSQCRITVAGLAS